MSVTAHRRSSWWNSRRTEFVLSVARLPLTLLVTFLAWSDGPRWMFFLGLAISAGLVPLIVGDIRRWRRRRS